MERKHVYVERAFFIEYINVKPQPVEQFQQYNWRNEQTQTHPESRRQSRREQEMQQYYKRPAKECGFSYENNI